MARVILVALALSCCIGCGGGGDSKKSHATGSLDAGLADGGRDAAAPDARTPEAGTGGVPLNTTPAKLSEWNLFTDLAKLVPAERVVAYEMRSPLFTDYALKQRFIYLPEGEQIEYDELAPWQFPVGAILIKQFSYLLDEADPKKGARHIETRLMIHRAEGWVPEVYVWNDQQTEADRDVTGATIAVTRKAADGTISKFDYGVPSRAECRKCHGTTPPVDGAQATRTLGPMTAQLNMDHDYGEGPVNQIDHLADLGWLDKKPAAQAKRLAFPFPDDEAAPVAERARAYLSANCAHCHSKGGEVFDKQLWLDWQSTDPGEDPYLWGVCKKPTSAGNAECESTLDIVPGDPDASLLVCRMESLGKGRMAPLGRNLVHTEGTALVRAWISGLTLPACTVE